VLEARYPKGQRLVGVGDRKTYAFFIATSTNEFFVEHGRAWRGGNVPDSNGSCENGDTNIFKSTGEEKWVAR
jgi:hypothetical protein